MTVKWGDGMQDIKRYPLVDCVDEKPGWPRPKWAAFTLQHAYGNSGNYEVEVIVSSSGCDGGHAQSATETITVTAA